MATLETLEHLAIWTGKDPVVVAADVFAQLVMERATELVVEKAEIPATWETDPTVVPARAKTICLLVAARTYTNRRSVISQSVGPISETLMAQMAAAMQLTEAEAAELEALANENAGPFGGLYTITTTRGDDVPIIDNINLPDSSGSDWLIPYAVEGETGAFDTLAEEDVVSQAEFDALQALVNDLVTGKVSVADMNAALALKADADALAAKADKTYVDTQDGALDTRLDAAEADLATKAETSDLGVQIRLTQPESGSGELWADTSGV
jgi:hypothetical protein